MGTTLTIITRNYLTENDMRTGKKAMSPQGFRAIHTDFINNDRNQGFRITFDDSPDVLPPQIEMTAGEFIDFLMDERNVFQKPSSLARFRTLLRL